MVEYYKLRVANDNGGEHIYLRFENNKLSIEAEDGPALSDSSLVQITEEELKKALKDLR